MVQITAFFFLNLERLTVWLRLTVIYYLDNILQLTPTVRLAFLSSVFSSFCISFQVPILCDRNFSNNVIVATVSTVAEFSSQNCLYFCCQINPKLRKKAAWHLN